MKLLLHEQADPYVVAGLMEQLEAKNEDYASLEITLRNTAQLLASIIEFAKQKGIDISPRCAFYEWLRKGGADSFRERYPTNFEVIEYIHELTHPK